MDDVIMSEQKAALLSLADWCEEHGRVLDARIILIADSFFENPIGVNTDRDSALQQLRDLAENF